jgi:hypothetical protein
MHECENYQDTMLLVDKTLTLFRFAHHFLANWAQIQLRQLHRHQQ